MSVARLVLVGLPGAGKSTVARSLAEAWSCEALDTDDLIANIVGEPAALYLRTRGEPEFRARELEALREALASDAVVATGAGVVTTEAARSLLSGALTIWLDADDATLALRVVDGERPLLGDDHRAALVDLRRQRTPWYEEVARWRVDAAGTTAEVCERIVERLRAVDA